MMNDFALILGLSGLALGFMGLGKKPDRLPSLDSPTFQAIAIAGGDGEEFGDSTVCFSKLVPAGNYITISSPGLYRFQTPWLEKGVVTLKVEAKDELNISCMSWEANNGK
jgi:hypothetical protein